MMMHVINGDAMAEEFAGAGLPGEVVVWREAAIDGPLAADMSTPAIRDARAEWMERELGVPAEEYRREFDRRERALADLADGREVELVLWFERDLFCEFHLLDLLGRPADRPWTVAVVHPPSLVLASAALAELFDRRRVCSTSERQQARAAWRALVSDDPHEFQALGSDSIWLAELLAGMQHDRRSCLPDARGLTRLDVVVLERLGSESCSPAELFRTVREHADTRGLGLGDSQVWVRLARLVERGLIHASEPLPRADRETAIDRPSLRASDEAIALLAT
jgi:hypothetical protein